jgi:diguanylate cyclase (GGDEF)-like protein/PAS domain S-box-containing protein
MGTSLLQNPNTVAALLNSMRGGIFLTGPDLSIQFWSQGAQELLGIAPKEVVGQPCKVVPFSDSSGQILTGDALPAMKAAKKRSVQTSVVKIRRKDGTHAWFDLRVTPLLEQDMVLGLIHEFSLLSVQTEVPNPNVLELCPVTGLRNRRSAEGVLREMLEEAREKELEVGLLLVHVDDLEAVNGKYGYEVGDLVMKMVGGCIQNVGDNDDLVARWSGAQFVVASLGVNHLRLELLADRVRANVSKSTRSISHCALTVTVSIGATMSRPADGIGELIRRANNLMKRSRDNGGNCLSVA